MKFLYKTKEQTKYVRFCETHTVCVIYFCFYSSPQLFKIIKPFLAQGYRDPGWWVDLAIGGRLQISKSGEGKKPCG